MLGNMPDPVYFIITEQNYNLIMKVIKEVYNMFMLLIASILINAFLIGMIFVLPLYCYFFPMSLDE